MQNLSGRSPGPAPHDADASAEARHLREGQLRDALLTELDAQRAELRAALGPLTAHRNDPSGSGEAGRIEHQLTELNGLRQQVAFAGSLRQLGQLQQSVAGMGSRSSGIVSQAGDRAQSGPGALPAAEHRRRSAELAQEAHQAMAQNDRLFREGADVAARYGVDLSAFAQERAKLEKERDAADRRGNHLQARMADALIARNTTNALTETLPHVTDPAERARQLVRIEQAKTQEEAARKRLEQQAELDGRKQAFAAGMSPEAAKAHVESVKKETMQTYQERSSHLPHGTSGPRADLASPAEPAASAADALAGKLTPADTARVRQVAAVIAGSSPSDSREDESKAPTSTPKIERRSVEARTV